MGNEEITKNNDNNNYSNKVSGSGFTPVRPTFNLETGKNLNKPDEEVEMSLTADKVAATRAMNDGQSMAIQAVDEAQESRYSSSSSLTAVKELAMDEARDTAAATGDAITATMSATTSWYTDGRDSRKNPGEKFVDGVRKTVLTAADLAEKTRMNNDVAGTTMKFLDGIGSILEYNNSSGKVSYSDSAMTNLATAFTDMFNRFATSYSYCDDIINSILQNGDDSAVKSPDYGRKLKDFWIKNASTYENFPVLAGNWVDLICVAIKNNREVIDEVVELYKDSL